MTQLGLAAGLGEPAAADWLAEAMDGTLGAGAAEVGAGEAILMLGDTTSLAEGAAVGEGTTVAEGELAGASEAARLAAALVEIEGLADGGGEVGPQPAKSQTRAITNALAGTDVEMFRRSSGAICLLLRMPSPTSTFPLA